MRIRHDGKLWDVFLMDDGTVDTVISVQPIARAKNAYSAPREVRFDSEYAAQFRRSGGSMTLRGLRELGREAIEDYEELEGENDAI